MTSVERIAGFRVLDENHVHLWTTRLHGDAESAESVLEILDDNERRRAGKIIAPKGRERYIAAHVFMRNALARYTGATPQELSFETDKRGKPSLSLRGDESTGHSRPFFSLSHSRDSAALAVSASAEVGADIEQIRDLDDLEELTLRYLALDEQQFVLGDVEHDEKIARFFRIWTRKEAVLKALGRGISVSLSSFSVVGDNPLAQEAEVRLPPQLFHRAGEIVFVCDADSRDGYATAVASICPIGRLLCIEADR